LFEIFNCSIGAAAEFHLIHKGDYIAWGTSAIHRPCCHL
jgi:hypothetical protein